MRWIGTQQNVDSPDGEYIYGKIRDWSGTTEGTPVDEALYGDIHQLIARMVQESGITPNGLPDNEYNGWQIYDAFIASSYKKVTIEIGNWDMQGTSSVSPAHGLDDNLQVRCVSIIIFNDSFSGSVYDFKAGGLVSVITATNITLLRTAAGPWDDAAYNDGTQNRGFVTFDIDERV